MDWSNTKIHCSSIYNIMAGNAKSNMQLYEEACADLVRKEEQWNKLIKKHGLKGEKLKVDMEKLKIFLPILEAQKDEEEPLSKGCKTHLSGVYAYVKYGKSAPYKDIGSKQTEKGKEVEEDAIMLVNKLDGLVLYKNEERVENGWFSGHPDAFEGENLMEATIIHDVKSPFDVETFFSYLGKDLPSVYYWQMQGYMDITGAKSAKVHFCLVNSPDHQIKSACDTLLRHMNVIYNESPEYLRAEQIMINNMTFDDMPLSERRIEFIVERNDSDIEKARKKVEKCREYLAEFENMHINPIFTDKTPILHQTDVL